MRTTMVAIVISFVLVSPVRATALTWVFSGTVTPGEAGEEALSELLGRELGGAGFRLRIFFETLREGTTLPRQQDINFGPADADVLLTPIGSERLRFDLRMRNTQYSAECIDVNHCDHGQSDFMGRRLRGVAFDDLNGLSFIEFAPPIELASLLAAPFHLGPIPDHAPSAEQNKVRVTLLGVPGVEATVRNFCADGSACAVRALTEDGSTLLFVTVALAGFLVLAAATRAESLFARLGRLPSRRKPPV